MQKNTYIEDVPRAVLERRWCGLSTERKLERWLLIFGVALLLFAGGFSLYQRWQDDQAAAYSAALLEEQAQLEISLPEPAPVPEPIPEEPVRQETPVERVPIREPEHHPLPEGVLAILSIPKLERQLPVWESYSEEQLKKTVCRYGEDRCEPDQLAIAGHSYRSHFRGLGKLEAGDNVSLTFEDGVRAYAVTAVEVIDGTDVDGFFSGTWDLSFFTCDSTSRRRIVIRCDERHVQPLDNPTSDR